MYLLSNFKFQSVLETNKGLEILMYCIELVEFPVLVQ